MGLNEHLLALRASAKTGRDPSCADETLFALIAKAKEIGAKHILEIGAAEGLTSVALALETGADVQAIEKDASRARLVREHVAAFSLEENVHILEGDAGEILPLLDATFDLIFLDGPKAQYLRYFPHCKRLLRRGGYLFSDDVLLFGWVLGSPPKKRKMLAQHIREYLDALMQDEDFHTELFEYGEGLAVSEKLN